MKKYLLAVMPFALILFMLGSGAFCAAAEEEKLLCDVCGGTVVTDRMVPIFGLIHGPECRHRVMDPSVRTLHDKNGVWAWDEQEHWQEWFRCCGREKEGSRGSHTMKEICLALPENGGTLQGTMCTVCGKANYQASGLTQENAASVSILLTEEKAFGQVQLAVSGADAENAPQIRVESVRNGAEFWIHVPFAENGTVKLLHFSEDGKIREPECDFEEAGFLFKVKKAGLVLLLYPAEL